MILAGDVGGTNTRIALYENGRLHSEEKYSSKKYPELEIIIQEYLKKVGVKVSAASFGIAGAVREGLCKATNLPWRVESARLSHVLNIPFFHLMNDLEANAYGVLALGPEDFCLLQKGKGPQVGNRALIAAGTGLGEAGFYWDGKRYHPFASEGGHADFAPRNEIEVDLLFYLRKRYGHVSYERVVSGPGLSEMYQFLLDTERETESEAVAEEMKTTEPPRVISSWGLSKKDPACTRALDWFVSLYGAEAGNWALKMLPFGGMYIGGGIAPHLIEALKHGEFLLSFCQKGRFDGLLESIPIQVVMNDKAALLGAAVYAEWQK